MVEKLGELKENILLANHTTFRIGGPARYFFEAASKKDIVQAIEWAKEKSLSYFILGGGSNLLVNDEGFDGLVIKMKNEKLKIINDNEKLKIEAEAGVQLAKLVIESIKNGLTGLEWAIGIPGTIGGAVCGNAGAYRQNIAEAVESVEVLNAEDLSIKTFNNQECCFAYRESIFKKDSRLVILSVKLILKKGEAKKAKELIKENLNNRKYKIPPFPSAGSVFKNLELKLQPNDFQKKIPPGQVKNGMVPAAYLIEQCGLKGKKIGGAQISEQHANFIVNLGKAKADEVLKLINLSKSEVKNKFGTELQEEIKYLGF